MDRDMIAGTGLAYDGPVARARLGDLRNVAIAVLVDARFGWGP
ncbi:hypothetical protein SH593_08090 [Sphingosinicella sp. LY1275]|nr:hypothetical protein [Sphingosinicella sp. LY1275]MEA1014514.1 hypothetical protein [Sphingosinicella sp. LY1275]